MAAGTRKSGSSGSHPDSSEDNSADDARTSDPPPGPFHSQGSSPTLLHRIRYAESILALAVAKQHIYAGTQSGEILVGALP